MSTVAHAVEVPEAFSCQDWVPSPETMYRMRVEKYEAMVASGVFTKPDRFQLLNGFLVKKMGQYPPHAASCEGISLNLQALLPAGWYVRNDRPLKIPSRVSVPEPDRSVVRGSWRDYEVRHPEPADVALVVETAESGLAADHTTMGRIYGTGNIPIYWIVNLINRRVEVFRDPSHAGYASWQIFGPGDSVPVVIDGVEVGLIAVDDILPRIKGE